MYSRSPVAHQLLTAAQEFAVVAAPVVIVAAVFYVAVTSEPPPLIPQQGTGCGSYCGEPPEPIRIPVPTAPPVASDPNRTPGRPYHDRIPGRSYPVQPFWPPRPGDPDWVKEYPDYYPRSPSEPIPDPPPGQGSGGKFTEDREPDWVSPMPRRKQTFVPRSERKGHKWTDKDEAEWMQQENRKGEVPIEARRAF